MTGCGCRVSPAVAPGCRPHCWKRDWRESPSRLTAMNARRTCMKRKAAPASARPDCGRFPPTRHAGRKACPRQPDVARKPRATGAAAPRASGQRPGDTSRQLPAGGRLGHPCGRRGRAHLHRFRQQRAAELFRHHSAGGPARLPGFRPGRAGGAQDPHPRHCAGLSRPVRRSRSRTRRRSKC